MAETIIHIDMEAVNKRLNNGELWDKGWGDWEQSDAPTCLHGAIRYCQPVPGDAHLIEQVGNRFGFGTSDNDDCDTWACVVEKVQPDITDDMLADTFGPQWAELVAFVRRAAVITPHEAENLVAARGAARDAAWAAAWDAAWAAAWAAARDAARDAARAAARAAARDAARAAARDAARDAARVLAVRDLIGQHGFTQTHYDTLTRPWRQVIGPVHPDDAVLT